MKRSALFFYAAFCYLNTLLIKWKKNKFSLNTNKLVSFFLKQTNFLKIMATTTTTTKATEKQQQNTTTRIIIFFNFNYYLIKRKIII